MSMMDPIYGPLLEAELHRKMNLSAWHMCEHLCCYIYAHTYTHILLHKISGSSQPSYKSVTFLLGMWSECGNSRFCVGGNGVQSEPKLKNGASTSAGHPHTMMKYSSGQEETLHPFSLIKALNLFPLLTLPEQGVRHIRIENSLAPRDLPLS